MSQTAYPENDANTLYINSNYEQPGLHDILYLIAEHFGENTALMDVTIEAEHIQTRCIGYDRYDSSDYNDYLVIRKV